MGDDAVLGEVLRPVREEDLPLLERLRSPQVGSYNWFGYLPAADLRRRLDHDGLLGTDGGVLVVLAPDGSPVGDVGWSVFHHGMPPASRCWSIGITLVPEARGQGIGTRAQRTLAGYLLDTTRRP